MLYTKELISLAALQLLAQQSVAMTLQDNSGSDLAEDLMENMALLTAPITGLDVDIVAIPCEGETDDTILEKWCFTGSVVKVAPEPAPCPAIPSNSIVDMGVDIENDFCFNIEDFYTSNPNEEDRREVFENEWGVTEACD